MFGFLKIKMYRNNFIAFAISLLLACIVLSSILCSRVIGDQVTKEQNDANLAFNRLESNVELTKAKIDNHILTIYSNTELMNDFLIFFGNNAESYLTSRLNQFSSAQSAVSVINDMQNFVSTNQYSIKEIAFESSDTTNIIYFKNNGSTDIKFSIPNKDVVLTNELHTGYVYEKKLYSPLNFNRPVGIIRFVIDFDKLTQQSLSYNLGYTAIMNSQGTVYYPESASSKIKAGISGIRLADSSNSWSKGILFQKIYYSSLYSKTTGLKYITAVDTAAIVNNNRGMFLIILLGTLTLYLIMTFLVGARMRNEAKYLKRILTSIEHAKSGNFTKIDSNIRRDEYGIIAQALNEMSDQLDDYIRKEYILKLKQKETEMKMLQRQVNPHFLYNTLEIIRSCALINRDTSVADAIFNLGSMFREIVKSGDTITFEQEVNILTRYLKLMEFKFGGDFYYTIDFAPEILKTSTVKFWLQPLCENFFVHGYNKNSHFNLLVVSGTIVNDSYLIQISDNGAHLSQEKLEKINLLIRQKETESRRSVGLQNVFARLNYFYGDAKMEIFNNKEAGICVSVRIPKGKEEADV